MTRYDVVWHEDAESQLAQIWVAAADRGAVNASVAAIDAALSRDAHSQGREEHEGLRRFRAPPLSVQFEARQADRVVEVLTVKWIG